MNEDMPNGVENLSGIEGVGNEFGGNTLNAQNVGSELPAKVSVWTKLKDFLFQDVEKMELVLTPRQQKFFDFWTQDVTVDKVYNFLFQEIKFK